MRSGKQEHEADTKQLLAQGEQDAHSLTVRGTVRAKRAAARLEAALREKAAKDDGGCEQK